LKLVPQHAVQVAEHLAHSLHVLGAHALERLFHAGEEGLQHLLLQGLEQLLELPLRLGVDEVVVLELLDLAGGIRRKLVELALVLRAFLALGILRMPSFSVLTTCSSFFLTSSSGRAQVVAVELLLDAVAELLQEVLQPGICGPLGRACHAEERRSAFHRSPSAVRSSAIASSRSSASRSSIRCEPSQRE
jgi:hypothetical protein